jgi:hypothetical protein
MRYGLSIGNVLNAESNRGGAYGFKLESLERCFEIKYDADRKNLMSYILSVIKAKEPETLKWHPSPNEYNGMIISYATLAADLKLMKESIALIQKCMM